MRCQWFCRFSPGQSTTILVASHFGNIAVVCLYLGRILSSNDWIPFSKWRKICALHPMLVLAIVVDHSNLVLILGCPPFLPPLLTLMMSKLSRLRSFWTFQRNFVHFVTQQILRQYKESQPSLCLQVSWLLKSDPCQCQCCHQPVCLKWFLAAFW